MQFPTAHHLRVPVSDSPTGLGNGLREGTSGRKEHESLQPRELALPRLAMALLCVPRGGGHRMGVRGQWEWEVGTQPCRPDSWEAKAEATEEQGLVGSAGTGSGTAAREGQTTEGQHTGLGTERPTTRSSASPRWGGTADPGRSLLGCFSCPASSRPRPVKA